MKKLLALLLAMVMVLTPVLTLAEEATDEEPVEEITVELTGEAGKYIYKDSVSTLATLQMRLSSTGIPVNTLSTDSFSQPGATSFSQLSAK